MSAEEVLAAVIASVTLELEGNQAMFLVLLRGMGKRYTGPGQGALPGWMIVPWALPQPPAVFSWGVVATVHLVRSVTLHVALSSRLHTRKLYHHIFRPNSPSLLIHVFFTQKP